MLDNEDCPLSLHHWHYPHVEDRIKLVSPKRRTRSFRCRPAVAPLDTCAESSGVDSRESQDPSPGCEEWINSLLLIRKVSYFHPGSALSKYTLIRILVRSTFPSLLFIRSPVEALRVFTVLRVFMSLSSILSGYCLWSTSRCTRKYHSKSYGKVVGMAIITQRHMGTVWQARTSQFDTVTGRQPSNSRAADPPARDSVRWGR